MCQESDAKLRDYFRQPSPNCVGLRVKEKSIIDVDALHDFHHDTESTVNSIDFVGENSAKERMVKCKTGSPNSTRKHSIKRNARAGAKSSAEFEDQLKVKPGKALTATKLYFCHVCSPPRAFTTLRGYHKHSTTHEKNFSCETCFVQFTCEEGREAHMEGYGHRVNKLKCDTCGLQFSIRANFMYVRRKQIGGQFSPIK